MFTSHAQIFKTYYLLLVPISGLIIGWKLDRMESERMTLFRDKSALYGGDVKPGDPPSWP